MPAVVLLSGGLDSAVNLKRAHDEAGIALALTFDYGHRAARREIEAAALMCESLDVPHRVIELPWLRDISCSALTERGYAIPDVTEEMLATPAVTRGDTAAAVWVANRNGIFVNVAAAFAETLDCDLVVAGFNAEEGATFPDNSPEFVAASNRALELSTQRAPRLISYTQDLTKVDIVRLGREIGAPLRLVWSCYRGGGQHCWRCESCARLRRALETAGAWDWFSSRQGKLAD
jgi:7-cyano-7-deazaguanine synthase